MPFVLISYIIQLNLLYNSLLQDEINMCLILQYIFVTLNNFNPECVYNATNSS